MRVRASLVVCIAGLSCLSHSVSADSVSYTSAQAAAGKETYNQACLPCHRPTGGSGIVPVLVGKSFKTRWAGRPIADLYSAVRRMPPGGNLGEENYINTVAYLLEVHGVKAARKALPADASALAAMNFPLSKDAIATHTVPGQKDHPLLASLTPVTTELLANPPAGEWPSWGRDNKRNGFSPLRDINKKTVSRLQSAWTVKLADGNNNPTPLIHDGVMFLYTFPDTVMALDATSGELLWRYQREPEGIAPDRKMGIALGGDKVFMPTSDMRVLALNMKTGAEVWETEIASNLNLPVDNTGGSRYKLRAAPIVAGGKVIMGVVSSVVPTGGFIFALDMNTGKEAWRFRTIAQPGTPGGNSWNGQPAERRTGGSVWSSGSYDPELGLVYFGIAPTYMVQPFYQPSDDPTQTREAKFTNGTVALDVGTGQLRWNYSHHILDHWDLDWTFERQLMDLTVKGKKRRALATVSKGALLDALDAETGEYLFSIDVGIQTTVGTIDPETGMKTNNPETEPGSEGSYLVCPTAFGARS